MKRLEEIIKNELADTATELSYIDDELLNHSKNRIMLITAIKAVILI